MPESDWDLWEREFGDQIEWAICMVAFTVLDLHVCNKTEHES